MTCVLFVDRLFVQLYYYIFKRLQLPAVPPLPFVWDAGWGVGGGPSGGGGGQSGEWGGGYSFVSNIVEPSWPRNPHPKLPLNVLVMKLSMKLLIYL